MKETTFLGTPYILPGHFWPIIVLQIQHEAKETAKENSGKFEV